MFNPAHLAQFHAAGRPANGWALMTKVWSLGIIHLPVNFSVRNRLQWFLKLKAGFIPRIATPFFFSFRGAESLVGIGGRFFLLAFRFLPFEKLCVCWNDKYYYPQHNKRGENNLS